MLEIKWEALGTQMVLCDRKLPCVEDFIER